MKYALYERMVALSGEVTDDNDKPLNLPVLENKSCEIRGVRGSKVLEYLVQFDYAVCTPPVWILESNLKRYGV